jgi:hypothetical protein
MSDCSLETQSWTATDQVISRQTTRLTGFRTTCVEAWFNGIADANIEAMCGWSLTRFGVAKLRAAVRAMLKHTMALPFKWLLGVALQGRQAAPGKQTAILLAIRQIVAIPETSPRALGCYR